MYGCWPVATRITWSRRSYKAVARALRDAGSPSTARVAACQYEGIAVTSERPLSVLDYGSGTCARSSEPSSVPERPIELSADLEACLAVTAWSYRGVGAFEACMAAARGAGRIIGPRLRRRSPVLGICVGMQGAFDRGIEHGVSTDGVRRVRARSSGCSADRAAHGLEHRATAGSSGMFAGLEGERFYFVHSYAYDGGPAAA
jgi:glutamine amidotransferase